MEQRWDEIVSYTNDGIIDFGQTFFSQHDDNDMDQEPLYYQLRLSVFDYFNNLFGPMMNSYFIAKLRLCNDPDRSTDTTSATTCRDEYNDNLDKARELIEDMNIWLIKALLKIRKEIYSYEILSKDLVTYPVTWDWDEGDTVFYIDGFHQYHRMSRLYFGEDQYGEGVPRAIGMDSDNVDVFIKMDEHKWCDAGYFWCSTYETETGTLPTKHQEKPSQTCKTRLQDTGNTKQQEFRSEIDQYWYNLKNKFLYPMAGRIESIYSIPYLDDETGDEDLQSRVMKR